jgi:hypothetical protein
MAKQTLKHPRISIDETEDQLSIAINGKIPAAQFNMLALWFLLWTIAGIIVISQMFAPMDQNVKIFLLVWLGFWFYFEAKIGKALMWRKSGVEKILINKDKFRLGFEVPFGTRIYEFNTSNVRNFHSLEKEKGVFIKNYFDSFWVVGGESIGFFANGKLQSFGRQLDEETAKQLLKKIIHKVDKFHAMEEQVN